MGEDIERLLDGIGAISELCMAFFRSLLKVGFKEDQAIKLVQAFIVAMVRSGEQR